MNDYIYRLLISKAGITPNATGLADLEDGELLVVDNTFSPVLPGDTVTGSPEIYIAQGTASGDAPKLSARLQGANITKLSGSSYAAATEQVSYIGDNSNAGTLGTIANSTEYSVHVIFTHDKGMWSKQPHKRTFHYTTDASGTAAELMNGLVAAMNADAEFARLATAVAETGGGSQGVKITGNALNKLYIDDYEQVKFEIAIDKGFTTDVPVDQFGYIQTNGTQTATSAQSVNPNPGVGTSALVEDLERRAMGFMGVTNLIKFPVPNYTKFTVAGEQYDIYVLEHFDRHFSGDLTAKRDFPELTIIANESTNTEMTAYLEGIMNPYVASVGLPAVTL